MIVRTFWIVLVLSAAAAWADPEPSFERGRYLVEGPAGCGNCHTPLGPDGPVPGMALAGRLVEENEAFRAFAGNLTPASRIAKWSDAELVRAIREGVRPDGSVMGPPMPFGFYRGLSDYDAYSMVLYLRSIVPVQNDTGTSQYNIPLPPSYGPPLTQVPHPTEEVSVAYGAYLAGPVAHCMDCHTTYGDKGPMIGTHLGAGGFEFHGPWGVSVASNITPHADGIAGYSDADLAAMITMGKRPDGSAMFPPMPYPYLAQMTEEDLAAILLYLRDLPAKPNP